VSPDAATPAWQDDFVNHLARSEAQRNPNASLKVQVDVAPKLGSTSRRVPHGLIVTQRSPEDVHPAVDLRNRRARLQRAARQGSIEAGKGYAFARKINSVP
jgi:hypothetical protein